MPAVTIRNLPEATHNALKLRASRHGRSTEAEIRDILEIAVRSPGRVRLGSELAALAREFGEVDVVLDRDDVLAETVSFE